MFNQLVDFEGINNLKNYNTNKCFSLKEISILVLSDDSSIAFLLEEAFLSESKEVNIFFTSLLSEVESYLLNNIIDFIIIKDASRSISSFKKLVSNLRNLMVEQYIPIINFTDESNEGKINELLNIFDDIQFNNDHKLHIYTKFCALKKFSNLHKDTTAQAKILNLFEEQHNSDLIVTKSLFENLAIPEKLNDARLGYYQNSESLFNGNFILSARSLSGDLCVFLGGFSGLGLTAAIGAMTISNIFTGMVNKGFSLAQILTEINKKLIQILPKKIYCSAACGYIDERNGLVHMFNSGIQYAYLQRQHDENISIEPKSLPLGLDIERKFQEEIHIFNVDIGDNIIFLNNKLKLNNTKFTGALSNIFQSHIIFEQLVKQLKTFSNKLGASTVKNLVYIATKVESVEKQFEEKNELSAITSTNKLDWELHFKLGVESLKTFDPLPLLLHIIVENPELKLHRSEIYTVLAELYSNSLEHGVLELDSKLKIGFHGFEKYYAERLARLDKLESGYVKFDISHKKISNARKLIISIEDSGSGFDTSKVKLPEETQYSGRGLPLLYSLCDVVRYNSKGNKVTTHYQW